MFSTVATNRELRTALLDKLSVTPQRLSQRVAQVKRIFGPMSTEDGTYLLAHSEGLDISKYLDQSTVDRVRGLLAIGTSPMPIQPPRVRTTAAQASRGIRIAPSLELVDALLPSSVAEEANRMARIYPKFYVLENSIRNVIIRVMKANHGTAWWSTRAPRQVQRRVGERRAKESEAPWHGRRGTHEIYYSDFGDLRDIISANWSDFDHIFPNQAWITQRLEDLEPSRNIVAHHNPLSQKEERRLELYFSDWVALINLKEDRIP